MANVRIFYNYEQMLGLKEEWTILIEVNTFIVLSDAHLDTGWDEVLQNKFLNFEAKNFIENEILVRNLFRNDKYWYAWNSFFTEVFQYFYVSFYFSYF